MKNHFANSIFVFGLACFLSSYAQAGNVTTSSATGNVTAIILCEEESGVNVDHSEVAINSDACTCTADDDDNEAVGCADEIEEGVACPVCLASLQRGGLSIKSANGYLDNDNDPAEKKTHYLLVGNSGPFLTRFGCYCEE